MTELHQQTTTAALEQIRHDFKPDDLVTKQDLKELELNTKRDLKELEQKMELMRAELKRDIAELKAEMIRWIVGAGFLQTTLIAALLLKLLST